MFWRRATPDRRSKLWLPDKRMVLNRLINVEAWLVLFINCITRLLLANIWSQFKTTPKGSVTGLILTRCDLRIGYESCVYVRRIHEMVYHAVDSSCIRRFILDTRWLGPFEKRDGTHRDGIAQVSSKIFKHPLPNNTSADAFVAPFKKYMYSWCVKESISRARVVRCDVGLLVMTSDSNL